MFYEHTTLEDIMYTTELVEKEESPARGRTVWHRENWAVARAGAASMGPEKLTGTRVLG